MSQIHQLQVRFDPSEDRALMRIRTRDDVEYRFWLTRRFVRLLWPMLRDLMKSDRMVREQADEQARSAVLSFQHEAALQTSDFSRPFGDGSLERPLGEAPALLTHIRTGTRPDGTRVLAMHPRDGRGIELGLDSGVLHSLGKLIADAARSAEWDLDVTIAAPGAGSAPPERVN